jgi:hypothetical protein
MLQNLIYIQERKELKSFVSIFEKPGWQPFKSKMAVTPLDDSYVSVA